MKQSICQKLLMSLAMVAFFGTLVSAQVLNRNQVDAKQIQTQQQTMMELKKKAKEQGLSAIPQAWLNEAQQRRNEVVKQARTTRTTDAKPTLKKVSKPNVERKTLNRESLSIYERAKHITPPPGYKVGIQAVGGKQYIQYIELPDQQGKVPTKVKN